MATPINQDLSVARIQKTGDEAPVSGRHRDLHPAPRDEATTRDEVTLTSPAQQLRAVQEVAYDTPEVDAAKVDAVRRAIEVGEYKVDSRKIAENLLLIENQLRSGEAR